MLRRWRKLEGSDPNTYNMITRTHSLQKQLIRRTEEVAEKDGMIQQKEKLYVELKAILARQPGPEVLSSPCSTGLASCPRPLHARE